MTTKTSGTERTRLLPSDSASSLGQTFDAATSTAAASASSATSGSAQASWNVDSSRTGTKGKASGVTEFARRRGKSEEQESKSEEEETAATFSRLDSYPYDSAKKAKYALPDSHNDNGNHATHEHAATDARVENHSSNSDVNSIASGGRDGYGGAKVDWRGEILRLTQRTAGITWIIFLSIVAFTSLIIAIVSYSFARDITCVPSVTAILPSGTTVLNPQSVDPSSIHTTDYSFDFNKVRPTDSNTTSGFIRPAYNQNWPATIGLFTSQSYFMLNPGGANSPHEHPNAVETLFVIEGQIEACFVPPNPGIASQRKCYTLTPNMSIIFPRGFLHFQRNTGPGIARYISTLNSDNPGVVSLAQRLCDLDQDILFSMFSHEGPLQIQEMCGMFSHLPDNPIRQRTAQGTRAVQELQRKILLRPDDGRRMNEQAPR